MSEDYKVPFTREHVLTKTAQSMIENIEWSIDRTLDRMHEFEHDSKKSTELFITLSTLHTMRKDLYDFQDKVEKGN